MNGRPLDDFDPTVHRALSDVAAAVRPDPDLADRLIANSRTPGRRVISLSAARRDHPWIMPLLAAATVAALAISGTAGANLLADSRPHRPGTGPSIVVRPSIQPSRTVTPTPTSSAKQAYNHAGSATLPPTPTAWPNFRANSITFRDPEHGWVLGDAECPLETPSTCAALLATSNGGKSWHRLFVPTELDPTLNAASCGTDRTSSRPCADHVLFANDHVGYLWGLHDIYSTTDGGMTWSHYNNPATAWDGATQMVIAGGSVIRIAPVEECSAHCPGDVQTAPVGTTDFTTVTTPSGQVGLSSTLAVHGGDAYLFDGGDGPHPGLGILRSTDGGTTWQQVAHEPCGSDLSLDGTLSVVAADGALVADCSGTSFRVAQVGSSDFADGGSYPAGNAPSIVAAGSAEAIIAAEVSNAYPGTELPVLSTCYTTTDGGQNWQRGTTIRTASPGVTFVDQSVGYAAAATGSFYLTHDGGITWSEQPFIR